MHAACEKQITCSALLRLRCLSLMLMPLKVARFALQIASTMTRYTSMAPHHLSQVGLPVPAIAFAFVHLGILVCRRCSVLALFMSARKESVDNIRIHTCDFVMSRSRSAAVGVPRALASAASEAPWIVVLSFGQSLFFS